LAVLAALAVLVAVTVFPGGCEQTGGGRPSAALPPRMVLPVPPEPLEGTLELRLEGARGRGVVLIDGLPAAYAPAGSSTLRLKVREGDLVEVDGRACGRLRVAVAGLTEPLSLVPEERELEAGGRLCCLGWVRGPAWPR
jgi:hypothetical protein